MIASTILLTGAILSLFLAWDGGPRDGAIFLGVEKHDEEQATAPINNTGTHPREEPAPQVPTGPINLLRQSVNKKLSGYFASRVRDAHEFGLDAATSPSASSAVHSAKGRTFSRTSRANGSAYGYRRRQGSQTTLASGRRRSSLASTGRPRRDENHPQEGEVEAVQTPREDLNFAQRLVMGKLHSFNDENDPTALLFQLMNSLGRPLQVCGLPLPSMSTTKIRLLPLMMSCLLKRARKTTTTTSSLGLIRVSFLRCGGIVRFPAAAHLPH